MQTMSAKDMRMMGESTIANVCEIRLVDADAMIRAQ